ncbi:hypothetical protein O6H91_19G053300 [Diphasiastrum complanatum]|uniref:Uncharacterized protein n=1 Tax=Diphasiastrum complanatum TaxID=34168 RepID=A0ACC2AV75_DIPCM|nr:hypothetical protein O6H91_19G053300 [Diphasiastrum complanatum]
MLISQIWVFLLRILFIRIMSNYLWLTIIVLLPISAGLLIPLIPSYNEGNKIIRWYTLGICLLEFLLITHTFCYYFDINNAFIQLREDYSWINLIDFHRRLGINGFFIEAHLTDMSCHYFSYFSSLASYLHSTSIPFLDVSNV